MLIEKSVFPEEIQKIIGNSPVETDDVGRSGALVSFIGNDLVLKKTPKGKLQNAYHMQSFFHRHDRAPEVVFYLSEDFDYLISEKALGKSAIDKENLRRPAALAGALGEFLLKIHSLPIESCPIKNLTGNLFEEFDRSVQRNEGLYQHIADYIHIRSVSEAIAAVESSRGRLKNDTVLHGDYCLPNVMLENFAGKHVIDVGEGGVGDRHFDLFWGLWSLSYNLKTDAYREDFLTAYGKNRIENDLIYACGCLCSPI